MTSLVLKRPHTHAGKTHGVGDRIDIDATSANWLIAHDIAAPDSSAPAVEPPNPSKPNQRKESKS
jgi:hypothetical protein